MRVYHNQVYCCPREPCAVVECNQHIQRIRYYWKETLLSDQLPVAMVDFSTTCEAYRSEEYDEDSCV